MAIKTSGPLPLTDIVAEFGGTAPHSLSEYYKGGALVPAGANAPNVPSSGPIGMDDFYGAQKVVAGSADFTVPGTYSFTVPLFNSLTVEVWGPGGVGANHGTPSKANRTPDASSFGSVVANGGGHADLLQGGSGGTASGGTTNTTGEAGETASAGASQSPGYGGASANGGARATSSAQDGNWPGGGGAGSKSGGGDPGGGGGGGGYATRTYTVGQLTVGASMAVQVGQADDILSFLSPRPGSGADGRVRVSWS
jgi:hypothetical protein